jgi:hypothetical protein
VHAPRPLGWLTTGRFLRLVSALAGFAILGAILYNATMVDRVPPTYAIKVSSAASDGRALTLTAIDIDFSKDVRHESAESAFSITPTVPGSFHWQGLKLIWTPSQKLPLATEFRVHMAAGVEDLKGNVQRGVGDITFTTVGAPAVTAVAPLPNAVAVPVDSKIRITFDRLMDTQKVAAGLTVSPNFLFTVSWTGAVLTVAPASQLAFGTVYQVSVGDPAVDTDGTHIADWTTSFTTVGMGLKATALIPAPNVAGVNVRSPIAVVFDGPLDAASVGGAIKLTPPVSGSTRVVSLTDGASPSTSATGSAASSSGNVLLFTPDGSLAPHTTYTVTMSSAVRRADGEATLAQSWTFTTGEVPVNALNQIAFISGRTGVDNVWLMNPDGSNQRQLTYELNPVTAYDVTGDGTTIAYSAGGVVRRMSIGGDNLQTLTGSSYYEYSPAFTPNGTGLIVARRDRTGTDLGYWLIPMISGSETRQILADGAPPLGSTGNGSLDPTGRPGASIWSTRAAFNQVGTSMLIVRGSDNILEVVDLTGKTAPHKLPITGNSRGVWVQADASFFVAGTLDQGASWSFWSVTADGIYAEMGRAAADLDSNGRSLTYVVRTDSGGYRLAYSDGPGTAVIALTSDSLYQDMAPSFSPDGATIVFGRAKADNPTASAGIWIVKPDGTGLTNLSVDGAFPRWLP